MIRSLLLGLFFALISNSAQAAYPMCYVEDGVAHMFYCSDKSEHGHGVGVVRVYDKHHVKLQSEMVIWIGIAIDDCDEVDTLEVGPDAKYCRFSFTKDTDENFEDDSELENN